MQDDILTVVAVVCVDAELADDLEGVADAALAGIVVGTVHQSSAKSGAAWSRSAWNDLARCHRQK